MIKFAAITLVATLAFAAAPALAADPGANPAGVWVCNASGTAGPSGTLTMTETAYAFVQTGAGISSKGTYRVERNVVTVTSGPLRDKLGLGHGYFNTAGSPLALTFDNLAGHGMTCNPEIHL